MKNFPTPVVLSVVYDHLLCEIDDVYKLLEFVTGDTIFTHQLPRAASAAGPWILRGLPKLLDWKEDAQITTQNWRKYVKLAIERFGETLPIEPMPRSAWTHIDPVEEAKAMFGDEKVVVVDLGKPSTNRGKK